MPAKQRVINGITYPRDVAAPEGFPPGWKGVEQVFGENSKLAGKTYVRWSSENGKHRAIPNTTKVWQLHCQDHGLDFDTEYAKYERFLQEKAEERAREQEMRGTVPKGPKRDEYIALSQKHFGELTGPICFALPGWSCRWDLLPDSQQTPKTMKDPDGREYKLVVDIECKFGASITRAGGVVPDELAAAVEAAKNNFEAHALFSTGATRARESGGAIELSAFSSEVRVETAEERQQFRNSRGLKRRKTNPLIVYARTDDYKKWSVRVTALSEAGDAKVEGASAIRNLLVARCFGKRKGNLDFMLHVETTGQEKHAYAALLSGFYFLKGRDDSDRPVYQGIKISGANAKVLVGLDKYVHWNDTNGRWEMGTMRERKAAFAFSSSAVADAVSTQSWMILRSDFGSADSASSSTSRSTETPSAEPAAKLPATPEKRPTPDGELAAKDVAAISAEDTKQEKQGKKRKQHSSKEKKDTSAEDFKAAEDSNREKKDKPGKKKHMATEDTKAQPAVASQDAPALSDEKQGKKRKQDTNQEKNDIAAEDTKAQPAVASQESPTATEDPFEATSRAKWDGVWHTNKIWTYEECTQNRRCGEDLGCVPPPHWPPDVIVAPGKWVDWLPPYWGQCRRDAGAGLKTRFVSPDGTVFGDKISVEKFLNRPLVAPKIPDWPSWLPHDWGISMRSRNGKDIRIWVQPHRTRYVENKHEVEAILVKGEVNQRGSILKVKNPATPDAS
eukprot:TRINITY_DN4052_c0_g1_i1.p1 TRINITY_DN4052_c0_g1~~TRINITY_DN4052_c0_g1_i1.p1  ORF type:complete len:731 (+),score=110.09 TRINITY_DN4052_c0_g1_i1:96-2288(+)